MYLILTVLSFSYAIITLYTAIGGYKHVDKKTEQLVFMSANWKTGPVIEVQIVDGTEDAQCPPGFVFMFDRHWPGVYPGCICSFTEGYPN